MDFDPAGVLGADEWAQLVRWNGLISGMEKVLCLTTDEAVRIGRECQE